MPDNSEVEELPQGWKTKEYEITGHSRLYAVFHHEDSGREIHIVPYKAYGIRGSTNVHRVTAEDTDYGLQVIAEGLEVETVEEAEETAISAMNST